APNLDFGGTQHQNQMIPSCWRTARAPPLRRRNFSSGDGFCGSRRAFASRVDECPHDALAAPFDEDPMADDWVKKLVKDGVISKDQEAEARDLALKLGIKVEEALQRLEYISAADVAQAQAKQFGYDFVDVSTIQIPASVIQMVPESVARENLVGRLSLEGGGALTAAIHDPKKYELLDRLRFIITRDIRVAAAPKDVIRGAINRHYGQSETESVDSMIAEFT